MFACLCFLMAIVGYGAGVWDIIGQIGVGDRLTGNGPPKSDWLSHHRQTNRLARDANPIPQVSSPHRLGEPLAEPLIFLHRKAGEFSQLVLLVTVKRAS